MGVELNLMSFHLNYRIILTAAHCVCQYYDLEDQNKRLNRGCKANTDKPTNQQTTESENKLNYLTVKVGDKNFNKGTSVAIDKAVVMKTHLTNTVPQHVELQNDFDIGLLFPQTKDVKLYKQLSLRAITLAG